MSIAGRAAILAPLCCSVCQHPPQRVLFLAGSTLLLMLTCAARWPYCTHLHGGKFLQHTAHALMSALQQHVLGSRGQLRVWILPGEAQWGCWHWGWPGAALSTPHSCLQKLFSGGGRSRPSMARRWTMCFWMTSRQRVCREGTGRKQKEATELARLLARLRAEGCGGDGPGGTMF